MVPAPHAAAAAASTVGSPASEAGPQSRFTVYVANAGSDTVTPIATATNTAGPPITTGQTPSAIAINPDGKTAYVANLNSSTVTPITTATNTAGPPITVAASDPDRDIAITPDSRTPTS
jgi:YVTN family beta-propeller protein